MVDTPVNTTVAAPTSAAETSVQTPTQNPIAASTVVPSSSAAPTVIEATPTPVPAETPVSEAPIAPQTALAQALDKTVPEKVEPTTETTAEDPKEPQTTEQTPEAQSDEPTQVPVYDTFTVPEGVTLDSERTKQFTDILADLEKTGKVPHEFAQEFGQKAVNLYIAELQKSVEDVTKYYTTAWEKQKMDWKESFLKDPEIGGNRFQTTVDSAISFIRTHGGTADQQKEFRDVMESSGLGNHPAVIRLLANAGKGMSEGKPLAAQKPIVQQSKSKLEAMYGNKS